MQIFFVPVRELSHRSFVTGQTSQSQDPDRSSLRQLTHSSSGAPAPFLLEPSGVVLSWAVFVPSSCLLSSPASSWGLAGLSCCCRVGNNFLSCWLLPCSYRNSSLRELWMVVGLEEVTLSFLLSLIKYSPCWGLQDNHLCAPCLPAHIPTSWVLWEEASDMELGGRTLFRMGLCGQEGREAGWGRGEAAEWCRPNKPYLNPCGGQNPGLSVQDKMIRLSTSTVTSCFISGAYGKDITLGNAALLLRALLQGLQLQSICVPYSRQLGNMSFLERKFGHYNSISGLG